MKKVQIGVVLLTLFVGGTAELIAAKETFDNPQKQFAPSILAGQTANESSTANNSIPC